MNNLKSYIQYRIRLFWYSWDYYQSGFEGKVRYLQKEYKENTEVKKNIKLNNVLERLNKAVYPCIYDEDCAIKTGIFKKYDCEECKNRLIAKALEIKEVME